MKKLWSKENSKVVKLAEDYSLTSKYPLKTTPISKKTKEHEFILKEINKVIQALAKAQASYKKLTPNEPSGCQMFAESSGNLRNSHLRSVIS